MVTPRYRRCFEGCTVRPATSRSTVCFCERGILDRPRSVRRLLNGGRNISSSELPGANVRRSDSARRSCSVVRFCRASMTALGLGAAATMLTSSTYEVSVTSPALSLFSRAALA
jgi:hypothetical protein